VDLANAGFCDAEDLGDLREAEVFKVIHGENFLLHLGEHLKTFHHEFDEFLLECEIPGIRLILVGDDFVEAGVLIISCERVEFHIAERADFIEEDGVFLAGDTEFIGDFGFSGRSAYVLLEGGDDIGELFGFDAECAGHPVHAAEFVEHSPSDSHGSVGCEGNAVCGVEAALGLNEAEETDRVEVIDIEMCWEAGTHAIHHGADERHMVFKSLLFAAL
jgi:hypothetical protein